jgi:cobalt/nickel transport system permease protein
MIGSLAALPVQDSLLARLDGRWRLTGWLALTLAACVCQTLPAAGGALAAGILLALLARVPLSWSLVRLAAVLLLLLPAALLLPFAWTDAGPGWHLGPVTMTMSGLRLVALLYLKTAALVLLFQVLLVTAPLPETIKAAHALRLPGIVAQLILMAQRYAFVLGDELTHLRHALRVRGFRNRASRHGYRVVGHMAGTLFIRGCERAERVGQAMASRGYDGHFRTLSRFRTRNVDVLFALLSLGAAAGLLWWDWFDGRN